MRGLNVISIRSADGRSGSGHKDSCGNGLLQDRFQGAVIGLWMVPIALYSGGLYSKHVYSSGHSSDLSPLEADKVALFAAIARHLNWIDSFLRNPQQFKSSKVDLDSALTSLPVLLRYHSDSMKRYRAISELTYSKNQAQDAQCLAQRLILGEVLSMVLSDLGLAQSSLGIGSKPANQLQETFPTPAVLAARASDYGLASAEHRCYQDLWQSLRSQVLHGLAAASDAVVDGIAIALMHPNDYPTAVKKAQRTRETRLVAAVVAGALGGRQSLPVLWQLRTDANQTGFNRAELRQAIKPDYGEESIKLPQVIDMAECLFAQWAGISRKSRTIMSKQTDS